MYYTGDVGKWLEDGNIQYLGRNDEQIKVRGNRVELGEIENQLKSRCGLYDCLAVASRRNGGERILVYYTGEKDFDKKNCNDILSDFLPGYMLPDDYIRIENWPYTPNGKIDKALLPHPAQRHKETNSFKEALSEEERELARIWEETLETDRIGMEDNFFEIGGNSLTLAIVHSKISKAYPGAVKIVDMFAYPTIRKLAGYIKRSWEKKPHRTIHGTRFPEKYMTGGGRSEFEYEFTDIKRTAFAGREEFKYQIAAAVIYAISRFSEGGAVSLQYKSSAGFEELAYSVGEFENFAQIVKAVERDIRSVNSYYNMACAKEETPQPSRSAVCMLTFEKNSAFSGAVFDLIFEFTAETNLKMRLLSLKSCFDSRMLEEIAKKTVNIIKLLIK